MLNVLMKKEEAKRQIKSLYKKAITAKDVSYTYFLNIIYDDLTGMFWCIVLHYDDETNSIYAKIAYIPHNSLMHEYDMDFLMPYDENTGDVDDTETEFNGSDIDIQLLVDEFSRVIFNHSSVAQAA